MKTRKLLVTIATVGAVVGLAGCGGSSSGMAGSSQSSAPSSGMSTSAMGSTMSSSGMSSSSMAPSAGAMSSSSQQASAKATITIKDYKFQTPASVAPGATVTVKNMDSVNHTVTAKDKSLFDVTADADSATTFKAPSKPGKYPFGCNFHAQMHGVLVVK